MYTTRWEVYNLMRSRAMPTNLSYQMRVWAVPLFAVAYFCIAGIPALFHLGSGAERYLAYHFFVFTEVPSREETAYAAYVTSIRGKKIEPVPVQDAGVLLADEWRNRPEYARRIEAVGRQLAGNPGGASEVQRQFEELIIVRPLSYEIRELRYNPIAWYRTGEVISERVIRTFEAK